MTSTAPTPIVYLIVTGLNVRGDVLQSFIALPEPADEAAQVRAVICRWKATEEARLGVWARVTIKHDLHGPAVREYEVMTSAAEAPGAAP